MTLNTFCGTLEGDAWGGRLSCLPYIYQITEAKESNKAIINMKSNQKVNTITVEVIIGAEEAVLCYVCFPNGGKSESYKQRCEQGENLV